MGISERQGFLFIEENVNLENRNHQHIYVTTHSVNNQLKSIDDIKNQIVSEANIKNNKYNAIVNFKYGQTRKMIAFDDIVFYGEGELVELPSDIYNKFKSQLNEYQNKPVLIYKESTPVVYKDMPVQIDKIALYRFKDQFIYQVKLVNFSDKIVKRVNLELYAINSFNEIIGVPVTHLIERTTNESNGSFGDSSRYVFKEKNISYVKANIKLVEFIDETISYESVGKKEVNQLIFNQIFDENELYFIKKKYGSLNLKYDQFVPEIIFNYILRNDGTIHEIRSEENIQYIRKLIDYVKGDELIKDVEDHHRKLEEERKRQEEERKRQEEERKKKNKKITKIAVPFVLALALIISIIYFVVIPSNQYKEAETFYYNGNKSEALKIFLELDDFKDSDKYIDNILSDSLGSNNYKAIKNAEIGDIVKLGKYEQDGNIGNGKESITWIVLDNKDGQLLLISEKVIDFKKYNDKDTDVTWETCTLRKWLNGSFLNEVFTTSEQIIISESEVVPDNDDYEYSDGGKKTKDRIFLLSGDEVNYYFSSDKNTCALIDESLMTAMSSKIENITYDSYTSSRCIYLKTTATWWLRSVGTLNHEAQYVYSFGGIKEWGDPVDELKGIRPAMWITIGD